MFFENCILQTIFNFILIENQDKTVTQVELEASKKKHIGQANKSAGWMPWH